MKRLFTFFAAMCVLVATSWAETCGLNQTVNTNMHIHVIVGGRTFAATLADNETSEAFVALLPLSVTMNELNGNEKYHYLSSSLPTNSYAPGTIQAGDLMLYGNNCIVLFYETFSSKKAALVCAYYNCIKENNIDVVVDPIVKYTKYSMFVSKDVKNAENAKWWKPQYKAEIVGYAGKYVKVETSAEQVNDFKDVDMNDVVKYKMVTDPDFYKSYYQSKESNVINVYTDGNRDSSKKVKKPINQLQK